MKWAFLKSLHMFPKSISDSNITESNIADSNIADSNIADTSGYVFVQFDIN